MPRAFFHIALDVFGAECLGEAKRLLLLDEGRYQEAHFYVWGGVTSPPQNDHFWTPGFPLWDFLWWGNDQENPYQEKKHVLPGLDLDRNALAKDIQAKFSDTIVHKKMKKLFVELPKKTFGNNPFQSYFTITGSLADPTGNASFLGFLAGLRDFREAGLFDLNGACLMGTGAASGIEGCREDLIRVLVGRGLWDLESFFQKAPGRLAEKAMPIYLVGERPIENVHADRHTQVGIGAMGLWCLTRNIHQGQAFEDQAGPVINPLLFRVSSDQNIYQANTKFDPFRPFSVLGAFGFHCPAVIVSTIFAARFCADYLKGFLGQKVCLSVEEAAKNSTLEPAVDAFFADLEARASRVFWEKIEGRYGGTVQNPGQSSPSWFEVSRLKSLWEPLFKTKEWEKLLDWYSIDRLRRIPLEDWVGAIDELEEVIEQGVIPRREQEVENRTRNLLLSFIEMLDRACDEIFAGTLNERVGFRPHERAVEFLGRIWRKLDQAEEEIEEIAVKAPQSRISLEEVRQRSDSERESLDNDLAEISSPAAVLVRLVPVFIGFFGLCLVPVDLGVAGNLYFRAGIGCIFGFGAVAWFFWQHVSSVKRRITSSYYKWFETYKQLLALEDEKLQKQSYLTALKYMKSVLVWYLEGEEEKPPLPEKYLIHLNHKNVTNRKSNVPEGEFLSRKDSLSSFKKVLGMAVEKYSELARFLKESLYDTPVQYNLPNFEELDKQYASLFSTESPDDLRTFLLRIVDHHRQREQQFFVPFIESESETCSKVPAWRRSWLLPNGFDLMSEDVRCQSSGFEFYATVERYLRIQRRDLYKLGPRLAEQMEMEGKYCFSETTLGRYYNHFDRPSMEVSGDKEARLVFACGKGDPAANACNWDNDLGGDSLSISLRVNYQLNAQDVIYFPNKNAPQTPLGKACKLYEDKLPEQPAFKPVVW